MTTKWNDTVVSALGKRECDVQGNKSASDLIISQARIEKEVDKKSLKRYLRKSLRSVTDVSPSAKM